MRPPDESLLDSIKKILDLAKKCLIMILLKWQK